MVSEVEDCSIAGDQSIAGDGWVKVVMHGSHFGRIPCLRHVGPEWLHFILAQQFTSGFGVMSLSDIWWQVVDVE